ncbi:MAG TPA: AMP-binding protein [Spongiibacteraceae bacterium]|jgi:long-subunit acyl-CoA synthetase (AMP-forming)|nr:AMP-binding protein [Spongiibacteraceae bacterium]HUH37559.1 AMP-binding protein [Spongiibacteraceae bacterium]
MPLPDLLTSSDRTLLVGDAVALSQRQLLAQAQALADELTAAGAVVVALVADNGPDWLIADLAAQLAGVVLVPLPGFFSPNQLFHSAVTAGVDTLLCDDPKTTLGWLRRPVKAIRTTALPSLQLVGIEPARRAALPAGTAKITFTSGSTGQPKGVCLSDQQQLEQALRLQRRLTLDSPRHLCVLPLSTLLENVAGAYTALLSSGQVLLPSLQALGFSGSRLVDGKRLLATISTTEPTTAIVTPALLQLLATAAAQGWQPPSSLTMVAVGGARVSPRVLEQARAAGIPAYEGYGLSECCSVVSVNSPAADAVGSSGRVLPGLDVCTEAGEIVVAGNAMLGYVDEPGSWGQARIHTGDLGRLDGDILTVTGRRKNLLVSAYGRNISPEWLEAEMVAGTAVGECVVFGDAMPYCVALLSPRDPALTDAAIDDWVSAVNHTLPDYARIQRWHRLQRPLAESEGLLTDNGRPRRESIQRRYHRELMALYDAVPEELNP